LTIGAFHEWGKERQVRSDPGPQEELARKLREDAHRVAIEAQTLAGIKGLESEVAAWQEKAKELHNEARELRAKARLEDITVRRNPIIKRTKKGKRTYYRWVCSWQEGDKTITKYLGSCRKMSEAEALRKARKLKAEALGEGRQDQADYWQTW
jgi:hypothetical protein